MTRESDTDDETARLLARAAACLPGGALHHLFRLPDGARRVVARARGSRLWDVAGREYVDYFMGAAAIVVGHADPEVEEAIRKQLADGTQYYELSPPAIALAEALTAAIPCAERVKFAASGTEATMVCLRLARAFSGRDKILKFEGAWHGAHDAGTVSYVRSRRIAYPHAPSDSLGVPRAVTDLVLVAPFNDLAATEAILAAHADGLGAVIVEPTLGAIPPVPGFLEGVRALTRRHGIPLVFDELVSGFRLGLGGAQQHYGVTPDLAAFGKALGSGFPIGVIAGRADILALMSPEAVDAGAFVMYSGTFSGNPLSSAAALATLAILRRPGSFERLSAMGQRLAEGLRVIADSAGRPFSVTQAGPMVQFWFAAAPVRGMPDTWSADAELLARFQTELIRRGIWAPVGVPLFPSLAHGDADIDRTLAAAEAAMRAL